jgi:hypothetical protein
MAHLLWSVIQRASARDFDELDLGRCDFGNVALATFRDHCASGRSVVSYWRFPATESPGESAIRIGFATCKTSLGVCSDSLFGARRPTVVQACGLISGFSTSPLMGAATSRPRCCRRIAFWAHKRSSVCGLLLLFWKPFGSLKKASGCPDARNVRQPSSRTLGSVAVSKTRDGMGLACATGDGSFRTDVGVWLQRNRAPGTGSHAHTN